jgi:hypothetical protein
VTTLDSKKILIVGHLKHLIGHKWGLSNQKLMKVQNYKTLCN